MSKVTPSISDKYKETTIFLKLFLKYYFCCGHPDCLKQTYIISEYFTKIGYFCRKMQLKSKQFGWYEEFHQRITITHKVKLDYCC